MITDARDSPVSPSPAGMAPKRIQLSRARGWRLPPNASVISRPSRYGNPWRVVEDTNGAWQVKGHGIRYTGFGSKAEATVAALERFADALDHALKYGFGSAGLRFDEADLAALRGRDVACWCPIDSACHGDVLLELAAE